jgi:flagellar biogenesis protein FliO
MRQHHAAMSKPFQFSMAGMFLAIALVCVAVWLFGGLAEKASGGLTKSREEFTGR